MCLCAFVCLEIDVTFETDLTACRLRCHRHRIVHSAVKICPNFLITRLGNIMVIWRRRKGVCRVGIDGR